MNLKPGARSDTAQKMKFSIKDLFSKCDQIGRKLGIWSHLLKKSLIEEFIFCAVLSELLNPFHATGFFLYPLKTLENLWFSDVFRVYRKGLVP